MYSYWFAIVDNYTSNKNFSLSWFHNLLIFYLFIFNFITLFYKHSWIHPWGTQYKKDRGTHHTFQGLKNGFGTSSGVQPRKAHRRSFGSTFYGIELKKNDRNCADLELAPLRGENNFKPLPQNRILVPLRGSFQNLWRAPRSFLYGTSPPGDGPQGKMLAHIMAQIISNIRVEIEEAVTFPCEIPWFLR